MEVMKKRLVWSSLLLQDSRPTRGSWRSMEIRSDQTSLTKLRISGGIVFQSRQKQPKTSPSLVQQQRRCQHYLQALSINSIRVRSIVTSRPEALSFRATKNYNMIKAKCSYTALPEKPSTEIKLSRLGLDLVNSELQEILKRNSWECVHLEDE